MTYVVARFHDTPGLPLPRSPMMFLVPQILRRATMSRPHPSGEGRGAGILVIIPGEQLPDSHFQ